MSPVFRSRLTRRASLVAALLVAAAPLSGGTPHVVEAPPSDAPGVLHVVLISVDGLRPDAVDALGPAGAPALHRLRAGGATTDNARADYDWTITLPNHTTQLTARGVNGARGHNWTTNVDPDPGQTLHANKGAYVASAFDVAHDAGLRTALFASKSKFTLFRDSYGPEHGAPDTTGTDDGQGKIDLFVADGDTGALVDRFVAELQVARPALAFLHLRDADSAGHGSGWDLAPGSPYLDAVRHADRLVGLVLAAIEGDPELRGTTAVILTADHGGSGRDHGQASSAAHYTVPFYVWGAGVDAGADLYALNGATRLDPGTGRPGYGAAVQPVRNGDAANLALDLLGLGDVPGGTLNTDAAPLAVSAGVETTANREGVPVGLGLVVAPNPAPGRTTVSFDVPTSGPVRVAVYDGLGREVAALVGGDRPAGRHRVPFDGAGLPRGVYVVRVEAGPVIQARAVTLVR